MVQIASYLVADSVATNCTDYIDEHGVRAVFDSSELNEGLAFRQSIPRELEIAEGRVFLAPREVSVVANRSPKPGSRDTLPSGCHRSPSRSWE
jgi:hypothetical protein